MTISLKDVTTLWEHVTAIERLLGIPTGDSPDQVRFGEIIHILKGWVTLCGIRAPLGTSGADEEERERYPVCTFCQEAGRGKEGEE